MNGSIVMSEFPVPDGRPPRYVNGTTSASSHPELVSGDLAIAPRRTFRSWRSPLDRRPTRGALGVLALLPSIVALLSTVAFRHDATLDERRCREAEICARLHAVAPGGGRGRVPAGAEHARRRSGAGRTIPSFGCGVPAGIAKPAGSRWRVRTTTRSRRACPAMR